MKFLDGGLENISGFTFSAIECGIRYENRLDYCLIVSGKDCNAAGMFTTNKVSAAPVKLCRERIAGPVTPATRACATPRPPPLPPPGRWALPLAT